jgi:hypothetical protein
MEDGEKEQKRAKREKNSVEQIGREWNRVEQIGRE